MSTIYLNFFAKIVLALSWKEKMAFLGSTLCGKRKMIAVFSSIINYSATRYSVTATRWSMCQYQLTWCSCLYTADHECDRPVTAWLDWLWHFITLSAPRYLCHCCYIIKDMSKWSVCLWFYIFLKLFQCTSSTVSYEQEKRHKSQ